MKIEQIQTERKQIKDFRIALKDFEAMVKNPKFLHNGREIANFSLLPREAWGNWLLCAILREPHGDDITFAEDEKGDGIIIDKKSGKWIKTEHVCALDIPEANLLPKGEARVIAAIHHKIEKGTEYAQNKILVVFFDGAGEFYRNKIREAIKGKHGFDRVYTIGLLNFGKDGYAYAVTEFHDDFSITFKVLINSDFTAWIISQIKE